MSNVPKAVCQDESSRESPRVVLEQREHAGSDPPPLEGSHFRVGSLVLHSEGRVVSGDAAVVVTDVVLKL